MNLKGILVDNNTGPNPAHKLVLGNKSAIRARQNFNDVKCAATDRDFNSTRAKHTPSEIDLPSAGLLR
jgi:hypothetical protein